ncbi:hypothetical protein GJ744_009588 [Endocarpon pusillum]|uniref:Uncharacterized protein n=1 Tax=Endocarpon pusillum TaxID=364733 RepID=A0A8H7AJL6_9EURO|nr:hypothetical protein GJ744_009588 [Endocarpon pusillum]
MLLTLEEKVANELAKHHHLGLNPESSMSTSELGRDQKDMGTGIDTEVDTEIDTDSGFHREALSLRVVWTPALPFFLGGDHKIFIPMLYTVLADCYEQEA